MYTKIIKNYQEYKKLERENVNSQNGITEMFTNVLECSFPMNHRCVFNNTKKESRLSEVDC